ncbi:MAG: hypothetical protein JST67_09665 [Bacteroidetes bacterium]|nr:hypothetical protein [Bacteroidota bacterium]
MTRIFVSTSHICTLYMILYAQQTNKGAYRDVLLLDTPPKKASLKKLLFDTKKIYAWHDIIDLSPTLPEETDFEVSTRKALTRKWKNVFFIRPFYQFLLKKYVQKEDKKIQQKLQKIFIEPASVVELNLLTQTVINANLMQVFPKAQVHYFEHGMGDYFFIQQLPAKKFYCVFAQRFREHLQNTGQAFDYVYTLDTHSFPALAKQIVENDTLTATPPFLSDEKLVLILMESVQMYQVPDVFYTDYIDLCVSKIAQPKEYTYILKPHPFQTKQSLEISKKHFQQLGLKTTVLESTKSASYSAEVLYSLWQEQTYYVFSVFSSALYYISKLYYNDRTQFCYAYRFFKQYIDKAPEQYVRFFKGLEDPIKKVVSENATDIS